MTYACRIRKYSTKSDTHLFFPQFLYTINLYNDLRIGGSIVNIINVLEYIKTENGKKIYEKNNPFNYLGRETITRY